MTTLNRLDERLRLKTLAPPRSACCGTRAAPSSR